MWPNPKESADLVTFTEEIVNGKLHFLWSDMAFPSFPHFLPRKCHISFFSKHNTSDFCTKPAYIEGHNMMPYLFL